MSTTYLDSSEETPRETMNWPVALTIAGSDSSGGAGIQADLRSFQRQRVYGTSVITAVTAQNGAGVQAVQRLPASLVSAQMESVFTGMPVRAAKTGMLGDTAIIQAVAASWRQFATKDIALVVDPVMIATSGARLLDLDALQALRQDLIPLATLVTPNLPELQALTGMPVTRINERLEAAQLLLSWGCQAVLIKDGHGTGSRVSDILLSKQQRLEFRQSRLSGEFHGTGCTSSAAICAGLARGLPLHSAVDQALASLHSLLKSARPGLVGTVNYLP